jgi:hypothetical protein
MKKILKLSLATMAVAALTACGGGSSTPDAADLYVGTWKSKCFTYTGTDGQPHTETRKINLSKVSAAELNAVYTESTAFADTACKQSLGATGAPAGYKINIGAQESFLGAPADYAVFTFSTGEARQGYLKADSTTLLIVISDNSVTKPNGWSIASPYTKQ